MAKRRDKAAAEANVSADSSFWSDRAMTQSSLHNQRRVARAPVGENIRMTALSMAAISAVMMASALFFTTPAAAKAARNSPLWLQSDSIDFTRELGAPPANNTPAAQADLDAVVAATKARTPEREAMAIEDARQTLVRFLEGMDIDISKKQTSEARGLFKEINTEMEILLHRFKLQYDRRRPFQANKKIVKACAKNQPKSSSYPSTHAATGTLFAALLSEAAPELRTRLEARGLTYGESRTICGFHYPSDTAAGMKAGLLVAKALLTNAPFKTRFIETRAEIRSMLGL